MKSKSKRSTNLLSMLIIISLLGLYRQQQTDYTANNGEQVNYQSEQQLRTSKQRTQQNNQVIKFYSEYNFSTSFSSQFCFDITNTYQEFHFHLPSDQKISFLFKIYILRNNIYRQIDNIDNQPAMHLIVYENNHKIIAQKQVFFQGVVTIEGKSQSSYMMRFFSYSPKMMIVNHNPFLQTSTIQNKIKSSEIEAKFQKLTNFNNKLVQITQDLRLTHSLQGNDREQLTNRTQKYSKFQLIEIVFVVVISFLQIKMVSQLFKSDSIV